MALLTVYIGVASFTSAVESNQRRQQVISPLRRPGLLAIALLLASGWAGGCASGTGLKLLNYLPDGTVQRYHEGFDEAYYKLDGSGNIDVVLRQVTPSELHPGETIVQLVHIRSFWRSIPGTTIAHETQINGTITYMIVMGQGGTSYEGSGSVFFEADDGEVVGSVDRALLTPLRSFNDGEPLFNKCELSGKFTARRDPRRVVRLINDMETRLGPRPRFNQPPTS